MFSSSCKSRILNSVLLLLLMSAIILFHLVFPVFFSPLSGKSEANCTFFLEENPKGSCECFERGPSSFPTTQHYDTGVPSTYVCNLVRGSTWHSGHTPQGATSPPPRKSYNLLYIYSRIGTIYIHLLKLFWLSRSTAEQYLTFSGISFYLNIYTFTLKWLKGVM